MTVTDENDTYTANLTLTNAGTIDAGSIKVTPSGVCASQYTEGSSTLSAGVTAGDPVTTVSFTGGDATFKTGDSVVVSETVSGVTHAQTFIASADSSAGSVAVSSGPAQTWNYAYTGAATVSGPEFNGAGTPQTLCDALTLSITEESSSTFDPALASGTQCAYGVAGTGTFASTVCDLDTSPALSSFTSAHTLPNTALTHGASRYFLVAVHYGGSAFDNTYQNTGTTAFGLTWHIDQA
jgi:hypothetical protein